MKSVDLKKGPCFTHLSSHWKTAFPLLACLERLRQVWYRKAWVVQSCDPHFLTLRKRHDAQTLRHGVIRVQKFCISLNPAAADVDFILSRFNFPHPFLPQLLVLRYLPCSLSFLLCSCYVACISVDKCFSSAYQGDVIKEKLSSLQGKNLDHFYYCLLAVWYVARSCLKLNKPKTSLVLCSVGGVEWLQMLNLLKQG